MSKHTPGPWKVYKARLRPEFPVVITEIQDEQGNAIIKWQGFDGMKKKVIAANATLISAAPDLMEACKSMINSSNLWIPRMVSEEFEDEARVLHSLRQRILSAIIKAEGKP
jgi:hypothetical protein